jgi:hypothetical protein
MEQIYSKNSKIIFSLVFIILLIFGCDDKKPEENITQTDEEIRLLIEKSSPLMLKLTWFPGHAMTDCQILFTYGGE